MERGSHPTGAGIECLTKDNYLDWSFQVKTYLMAQDLWNIVEPTDESTNAEYDPCWTKQNAMTLHVIHVYCGPYFSSLIRLITSAKIAWDTLAAIFEHPKSSYIVDREETLEAWSVRMKTYLMTIDLWDIFEATTEPPAPEDENAFNAWSKKNAVALYLIKESSSKLDDIDSEIYFDSTDHRMAKFFWEILEEKLSKERENAGRQGRENRNRSPERYGHCNPFTQFPAIGDRRINLHPRIVGSLSAYGDTDSFGSESSDADDEYAAYTDLYKAVQSNDWNTTEEFFRDHPDTIDKKITPLDKTALHVAVAAGHVNMVNELVKLMSEEQLLIKDENGLTALDETTLVGNQEMAECILRKNRNLVSDGNEKKSIPVVLALANGHMKLARCLYKITPLGDLMPENGNHGATLLTEAIYNRNLDIALDIIRRCPKLTIARDRANRTPLLALTSMPCVFSSENSLVFWKRWIYSRIDIQSTLTTNETRLNVLETEEQTSDRSSIVRSGIDIQSTLTTNETRLNVLETEERTSDRSSIVRSGIKHLRDMKLLNIQSRELMSRMCEVVSQPNQRKRKRKCINEAIFEAIKHGIFEFVSDIVKRNPELLWSRNSDGLTIFHYAVLYREAKIFSLVYKLDAKSAVLSRTDHEGNNIFHMAGMPTKSTKLKRIPGAALQMQRELQWFKEVEAVVRPKFRETTNKSGLTPRELFIENHKDMMKEGEKWMKNTATSCTVVGTLIITIMFAAAFTVPGGYNQNTGYAIFSEKKLFMLFIVADSLSLFSSSTSVMMFLGILTSRYAEEDFLRSLPTKMIIGLATLFFAITTMMIAFSAALLIMQSGNLWIVIPIICLAIVPVTLFIIAQFRLLVDMYISTYGAGIFDRKMKPWL